MASKTSLRVLLPPPALNEKEEKTIEKSKGEPKKETSKVSSTVAQRIFKNLALIQKKPKLKATVKDRIKILRFRNKLEKARLQNELAKLKLQRKVELLRKRGVLPSPPPSPIYRVPLSHIHPDFTANNDINATFNADISHVERDGLFGREQWFIENDFINEDLLGNEDFFGGMINPRNGRNPLLW